MNKYTNNTEIKYEISDITKLVNSVDIIFNNYKMIDTLKKNNRKGSYILEDKNKKLVFLKAKLKDFVYKTEIDVYKILKTINSEYINKILGIYQTPKLLLVFFEYIDGICFDDLFQSSQSFQLFEPFKSIVYYDNINVNLFKRDIKLFDDNLDKIFKKLIIAIKTLYLAGIIHSDIKPSNIILKKNNNDMVPILIDFDLSKLCNDKQIWHIVPKFYGTIFYRSPETSFGKINSKSDVWNLGMLFYLFIFKNNILLSEQNTNVEINYDMIESYTGKHKKIVNLLKNMLTVNIIERISINDLMSLC